MLFCECDLEGFPNASETEKGIMKKSQVVSRSGRRKGAVGILSAFLLLLSLVTAGPAQAASDDVVVAEGESIQAAIDAADPGTKIVVEGAHTENLWIAKDNISIVGRNSHASITMPDVEDVAPNGCAPPEFSPVICFVPILEAFPPAPGDYLNGGLVAGLTINGGFKSVDMILTNRAYVRRNVMNGQQCNGVHIRFATKFDADNNTVMESPICEGIRVAASRRGRVSNNTSNNGFGGIAVTDSQHVTIRDNVTTGNCYGVFVFDNEDEGRYFGLFEEDQPSNNIVVKRNTANGNNKVCPFGPDLLGGTGIWIGGQNIKVTDNVANDNVIEGSTVSAGGIFVANNDLLGDRPATEGVVLRGNEALGNSSADGPGDVVITSDLAGVRVGRNTCGVSNPDGFCNYGD